MLTTNTSDETDVKIINMTIPTQGGNRVKSGHTYVINIILGTLVLALLMLIVSVSYRFKFINRNRYRYMVEVITGPRDIIRETEFDGRSN